MITPPNLGSGGGSCFPSMVIVAPGERLGQRDDIERRRSLEPRKFGDRVERDARLGGHALHVRLESLACVGYHLAGQGIDVVRGNHSELEQEAAGVGHDVERGAAFDHAGMGGGVRNVIERVARALAGEAVGHVTDIDDQARRILDRVDALGREWLEIPTIEETLGCVLKYKEDLDKANADLLGTILNTIRV